MVLEVERKEKEKQRAKHLQADRMLENQELIRVQRLSRDRASRDMLARQRQSQEVRGRLGGVCAVGLLLECLFSALPTSATI